MRTRRLYPSFAAARPVWYKPPMGQRYAAIRGTRDILPEEVGRWQYLERVTRACFPRYGFAEIRTPVFEHAALFARSVGETTDIVGKEMYTFERGEETLTLRPEATAPVVRAFVEHARHRAVAEGYPERLFYIGPMFRYERPQRGRQRQFHQVGVEVLGAPEPEADCETLEMLWGYLDELGLRNHRLVLNSVGDPSCRPGYRERLIGWLEPRIASFCEDCRRRYRDNPLRVFDCKVEEDRTRMADAPRLVDELCDACEQHFREVRTGLERGGVPFELDKDIVRGLDYYRRTVFEVVSDELGAQNAVVGGGRYDGLVQALGGPDLPGFGFALGMERLLELIPAERGAPAGPDVALVALGAEGWQGSRAIASRLRRAGLAVSAPLQERTLGAQLKRADRLGARHALFVGAQELAAGAFGLKNLASGEQAEVSLDEVEERVRDRDRDRG